MKKLIVITASILTSIVSMGEPFYLPMTSWEHLDNYVLKDGETAWLNDNGEPVLLFGNGTKQPYTMTLNRSLKIQNTYSEIDQSSLSIEKSSNVGFAAGTYVMTNTASAQQPTEFIATFVISSPPNTIMGVLDFDYTDIDFASRMGTGSQPEFKKSFRENTCTLTVKVQYQSAVKIWNFTAKLKSRNTDYDNDLTGDGSDVIIKDDGYEITGKFRPRKVSSGSSYSLKGLRKWVASLYNGNRGENWAEHKATATANMNGYNLNFSGGTHSNFVGIAYNLGTMYWYQQDVAMFFANNSNTGTPSADIAANATLRISKWDVDTSNTKIANGEFEYSGISNFDTAALKILSTYDLSKKTAWMEFPRTIVSITETNSTTHAGWGKFTVPVYENESSGFYKLKYVDLESQILQTVFVSDVVVKQKLVLRAPDGNYWAITVNNNGQLESTVYTKAVPTYGD